MAVVLLGVLVFLAASARAGAGAAIWTDKLHYSPEEVVTIYGVGFSRNAQVSLSVTRPDRSVDTWTVYSDSSGAFVTTYKLDGIAGSYTVVATDRKYSASTTFSDIIVDFRQCANEDPTLGSCHWINGILIPGNSALVEGNSVNQRIIFSGLPAASDNTHVLTFFHETTKGSVHAYDFITGYADLGNGPTITSLNPCGPEIGPPGSLETTCASIRSSGNVIDVVVPDDTYVDSSDGSVASRIATFEALYGNRMIRMYGDAAISSACFVATTDFSTCLGATALLTHTGPDTGDSDVHYALKWTSTSSTVLIEVAAHLSVSGNPSTNPLAWGSDQGASFIPGGSYHFKLEDLKTPNAIKSQDVVISLGNQDNQIQAGAVTIPPGHIIVDKVTDPSGDPTSFFFDASGLPSPYNDFSLTDASAPNDQTLEPGFYSVTETVPPGWDLTSLVCELLVSGTGSSSWDTSSPPTASITLGGGDTVKCTFTDTAHATLIVIKIVDNSAVPAGAPTLPENFWTMLVIANSPSPSSFPGAPSPGTTVSLKPGSYSVTESPTTAVVSNVQWTTTYTLGSSEGCSGTIAAGETRTCTITNVGVSTEQPNSFIIVRKITSPSGSTQSFEFDPSWDANFFLMDGQQNVSIALLSGTYSVSEIVPAGWDLTNAVCDDGSNPAAISLDIGETVTCTFTDVQRGRITIVKQTVPDGDPATFVFSGDVAGTLGDGGSASQEVIPGTYASTETVPTGWDLTSIVCDDLDSSGDLGTATATFVVSAGESVTCTFTDTKRGKIIVEKVTDPTGSLQEFEFDPSWTANFFLMDGQSEESDFLVPGTYSVSEMVPAGWDLTSATCDDGSDPASIDLAPGETVTCTFTDVQRGRIIVEKVTQPADSLQEFEFDPSWDANFFLMGGESNTSVLLVPGTYSVSEIVPAGWDLTSATCSDGSPIGAISLQAGETVRCRFVDVQRGKIIVEKQTIPDGAAGSFTFTGDVAGTIGDNGQLMEEVVPGTYSSTESVPDGWDLTSIVCDDLDSSGDLGTATATFVVSAGESVTCVFTDTQRGRIIVDKVTDPSGDPQSFAFTLTGGPDAISQSFSLTDAATPHDSGAIKPGTYAAAETVPAGWDLTSAVCDDGSPVDAISLQPGETVTCTFTDTKRGHILVDKVTIPAGDPQPFTFTPSWGAAFSLADASIPEDSGALIPGTYSVSETVPAGWDLTSATCDDGSPVDAISLQAGETVTCTFVDTKRGHIIVDKVTDPSGSPQSFSFDASGSPSTYSDFSLTDAAVPNDQELRPGTYAVAEIIPAGWDLTSAVCDDGSAPSAIGLSAGETVTCTFTDVQRGRIVVEKITDPVGSLQEFEFDPSWDANFFLMGGESNTSVLLVPGTYAVAEIIPAGWDLTSAVCDDGSAPSAIGLSAGETVTCTFTDVQRGKIIVEKVTIGGDASFEFDPSWTANFFLMNGQSEESDFLVPGTYSVAEVNIPAGWDLISATCDDGSDPSSIALAAGESVTCTFTDRLRGKIIVEKVTEPADSLQEFEFDPSWTANFFLMDGQSEESDFLVPGTYSVSEIVPAGWDLTSAACSDGSPIGAISLQAGETVRCRFVDVQRGRITIVKQTVPDGDPATFVFSGDVAGTLGDGGSASQEVIPGTYASTETVPLGWDLTSIVCDDLDSSGDLGTATATFRVAAGESVTCTFTDTKRGHILVDKVTIPSGETQLFEFDPSWSDANFFLADADPVADSGALVPGTYSVAEVNIPTGWDLTSAVCDDGSDPSSIDLAAGETVTCVFTDTKRGHIIVDKVTDPSGDAQSFFFDASGSPSLYSDFSLTDTTAPNDQELKPGTYAVAESVPLGWDLTSAVCDDGSSVDAISLQAGETVRCVFTDTKRGRIIVEKVTIGGDASFEFDPSWTANFFLMNGQSEASDFLVPGTYSVAEVNIPTGWDLISATCNDGSDPSSIGLSAGESVTCTFTDRLRGKIIVEKQTIPDGAAGSFTFTGDVAGTIGDNGQLMAEVVPGTYSSTESVPSGWKLISIVCDDSDSSGDLGTATATFRVAAGETVKCTFTDLKLGSISGIKFHDRDGSGTRELPGEEVLAGWHIRLDLVGTDDAPACFAPNVVVLLGTNAVCEAITDGAGAYSFTGLLPGTYVVSEVLQPGWQQTAPASGTYTVVISSGQDETDKDFGNLSEHEGTIGFWRNWDKHNTYTAAQINGWLSTIDANSAWLLAEAGYSVDVGGMVQLIEDSTKNCKNFSPDSCAEKKFLAQYLALRLNVESGRKSLTTAYDLTTFSTAMTYLGISDPSSVTLAELFSAIESKAGTNPDRFQFLLMAGVCAYINNLGT